MKHLISILIISITIFGTHLSINNSRCVNLTKKIDEVCQINCCQKEQAPCCETNTCQVIVINYIIPDVFKINSGHIRTPLEKIKTQENNYKYDIYLKCFHPPENC